MTIENKNRDKKKKFRELANNRVPAAIKKIRLVGNLSNKNNYDYDDLEARQIIDALSKEIATLKYKFKSKKNNNSFRL